MCGPLHSPPCGAAQLPPGAVEKPRVAISAALAQLQPSPASLLEITADCLEAVLANLSPIDLCSSECAIRRLAWIRGRGGPAAVGARSTARPPKGPLNPPGYLLSWAGGRPQPRSCR